MTVLSSLLGALRDAARFNKHELAPPRVILWPDEDRLWAPALDSLRDSFPALWSLGDYAPEKATGPAAWLRHQLDTYSGAEVPVIYLPGVDRAAFRSASQCPQQATHLYALQFQGEFFTQRNGKNWTPLAFLSSRDGGLGLDVAADQETRKAIQECLRALLRVELADLQGRKLEAEDFRTIVDSDPARTLLKWMGSPAQVTANLAKAGSDWATFRASCRSRYGFDPEKDGAITAAEKLTEGKGHWPLVWRRYKEAPRLYPGVKELLASLPAMSLFAQAVEFRPSWNQQAESELASQLLTLASASQREALARIKTLAEQHVHRSEWVWAALDESPLAKAMVHLRVVGEVIETAANPTTWEALADYYRSTGWRADFGVLRALDEARSAAATKAVTIAIRAVYLPWLDKFSALAQAMAGAYPNSGPDTCRTLCIEEGSVHLFADGLRLDLARALEQRLRESGLPIETEFRSDWSALPTVTATAKPAWMPLADKLGGPLTGTGFQSKERATGRDLVQARFKQQLLPELGISFLESNEVGLPIGSAWTELGSVDTYGHAQGAKVAWRVDEELGVIQQRITDLLNAGWRKVNVITDHGWLMVPGGLPKSDLPKHLAASRWSRCATPQPGAQHGYPVTSWFWDPTEPVVLAPGVTCFVSGTEYAHGGLTMQEALIPTLTVTARATSDGVAVSLRDLKWLGMRLHAVFVGAAGLVVDIRGKVADPTTSFAAAPVSAAADGARTSLLVPDDDRLGTTAFLVVVDKTGACIFKHTIVIGDS